MADTVHEWFGGSNVHRWIPCPGSIRLSAPLPPQLENEHMRRGTHAHALLEHALSNGIMDSVANFDGLTVLQGYDPFTAEDVDAVQVAIDHVQSILSEFPDAHLWVERKFLIAENVGGTVDVLIYDPATRRLWVIDYKHGAGKFVEVAGNPQARFYALAAVLEFAEAVESVTVEIIQPRCPVGAPIRGETFPAIDLLDFMQDVNDAVENARSEAPRLSAGEHCRWCPAAHICPALGNAPAEIANLWPAKGEAITLHLPAPGDCTDPELLGKTLDVADRLDAWIEAIRSNAYTLASAGTDVPGYKLVEKRAMKKWVDADTAPTALAEAGLSGFMVEKLISVAQVEKLAKAQLGKGFEAKIAPLFKKESSGTKLVSVSEKGDPVNPIALAAAGFTNPVNFDFDN